MISDLGGKNGLISIELSTVKDINSKYQKYNLVVTAFEPKTNYLKNTIKKAVKVHYEKKDLSQVNHQLYEWLAIINDKSSNTKVSQNGSGVNTHSMQNGQKNAQNGGSNTQHSLETDGLDIRYSKRVGFDNALTGAEKKKYNRALQTGEDAGLRISDNSILVECENNSKYQYKYVVYDDMEDETVIRDVYAIGRIDPNVEDDVASLCHNIARYIRDVEELKYDNTKQHESVLGTCIQDTSYLLARYNNRSKRFHVIGRGSVENG